LDAYLIAQLIRADWESAAYEAYRRTSGVFFSSKKKPGKKRPVLTFTGHMHI